ncbi:MAG TPA: hypothetical protein VF552_03435 [Allosphingosinicella sp.]|jgi:hypothetical protein
MEEEKPNARTGTPDSPRSWGAAGDIDRREPEASDKFNGRSGGGDSGGGAYPNPHTGKEGKRGGFMDHGGQTEMAYHGTGQLGDTKTGGNANAPATEEKNADKAGRED